MRHITYCEKEVTVSLFVTASDSFSYCQKGNLLGTRHQRDSGVMNRSVYRSGLLSPLPIKIRAKMRAGDDRKAYVVTG